MDGNWTIALDNNGDIWTWGSNYSGALGNGKPLNAEFRRLPQKLVLDVKFTQISASLAGYWTALDTNGNIWGCGTASYGGLGTGAIINTIDNDIYAEKIYTPRQITNGTKFTKVITLQDATLALDEHGNIWGWGKNDFGVLMNEGKGNQQFLDIYYINTPTKLTNGKRYKDIDYNIIAAGAIDEEDNLYMWGNNSSGVLATSIDSCSISYEPIQVKSGTKFDKFSMGARHVVAIDTEGYLWVWGREEYLGISNNTISKLPGYSLANKSLYEPYKKGSTKYTNVYCDNNSGTTYAITGNNEYEYENNNHVVWGTLITDWTGDYNEQQELMNKLKELTIIGNGLGIDENGYMWRWDFNYIDNEGNKVKALKPIQITGEKYTVVFKDGDTILKTQTVLSGQAATAPEVPIKEGHTFVSWDKSFDNVTSNLIVNALWRRDTYTVTFKNGDTVEKIENVQWGQSAAAPNLNRVGYTLSWDKEYNIIKSNIIVNAIWTANTNTAYRVEHYVRNLDTEVEGYDIKETENKTGTTDTTATAIYKEYEGFTKDENNERKVESGNIAGNGSLVLKLYYSRNTYNITYELNGGTVSSPLTNSYIYGKEMILSNKVTKEGYTFAGWYDNSELNGSPITTIPATSTGAKTYYAKWTQNEFTVTFKNGDTVEKTEIVKLGESATAPELNRVGYTLTWDKGFNNVESDLEVNAIWTANTNTVYKVEHYVRNLDTEVEGYELRETENKIGTTDTTVTAIYKEYEGFTKDENNIRKIESGNIPGDGSLVLKLYYSRNSYSITYELNGGTVSSPLTNSYIYGKEMILSNKVTKEGYTFAGWYNNSELNGSPITTIPVTSTGSKTYYAKWIEKDKEYYILSEKYNIDTEENIITKVSPETTIENFLTKIETNGTSKVLNESGQEVSKTSLIGTGYKLQVTYKGEVYTYEIAVRGDIDGNGKLTITDLSMLNQALMKKITLTGIKEKAADIDYIGGITITDLSTLNQALMQKITL